MPNSIDIATIKKGQLIWECHGSNMAVIALEDAYPFQDMEECYPPGYAFHAYCINDERCFWMYKANDDKGYGPRLYSEPQYTGTDYLDLLGKMVKFYSNGGCDGVSCDLHRVKGK